VSIDHGLLSQKNDDVDEAQHVKETDQLYDWSNEKERRYAILTLYGLYSKNPMSGLRNAFLRALWSGFWCSQLLLGGLTK
jgi:ABC-type phosphonate transport system ATPase subunit